MIGYKIFRKDYITREYISMFNDNWHTIVYGKKEYVKQKSGWGPFALFATLQDAIKYKKQVGDKERYRLEDYYICKVEYKPSDEEALYCLHSKQIWLKEEKDPHDEVDSLIMKKYSQFLMYDLDLNKYMIPNNTVFATHVKILEEIPINGKEIDV